MQGDPLELCCLGGRHGSGHVLVWLYEEICVFGVRLDG